MRRVAISALLFILASLAADQPAYAHEPSPNPKDGVRYEQNLNGQAPLDLAFTDEAGMPVRLGDYFGRRPVALILAYYECPMLCSLALNDLAAAMKNLSFMPGKEYEVVTVSINPGETSVQAAQKKAEYLEELGQPGAGEGWHFLTGNHAAIDALAEAVGFHYTYDGETGEYAHPTGVVVLTPQGRISRYILGIGYTATDLRLGLVEASQNKIGSPVDQFFLLCYHYNPITGRYSLLINNVLRLAGIATALLVAGSVLMMIRRERKSAPAA